jgi:iron complex outermembrane receptor protein
MDWMRGIVGRRIFALIIPIGMAGAPVHAAEEGDLTRLSLEELLAVEVFSASKFLQKTSEAPAAVTVITADDIKTYGYRTLADILRSARGFYVTDDRNYQYVGVRGFNRPGDYNARLLLLVDGYRVNDAIYDSASIGGEFFLDVDLIERVEVVRGPGSSIYGSNAVFGVVNVITRRGRDIGGGEVAGSLASYRSGQGRVTYGRRFENDTEVMVSATYADSKGQDLYFPEFDAPATNGGIARGRDGENAQRLYGKVSHGGFALTAAHSERIKAVPTASFGSVFGDSRTETTDSQSVLDLAYQGGIGGNMELASHVYYGGYYYHGTFPWDQPPVTINKDDAWGEWWGAEGRLATRVGNHRLVAGLEYQNSFRQEQTNHDVDPHMSYLEARHSSNRKAIYVQDEVSLRDGLLLNAGLRYDRYSTVGGSLNPRLGLIVNPEAATTFKFLYGTAFRAPNALELYYASATLGSKPTEGLNPEEITSYEFVAEHRLQPNFRLTGIVYYNEISNLISQITDVDGLDVYRNTGNVHTTGAEFEVERAWTDSRRLRASYAWQITRDKATGAELENSPHQLVKLNYSEPMFAGALRVGAELQYTGSRKTLAGGRIGGYAIANLTLLSERLAKGMELSATAYNLLDKRYADPGRPEHLMDSIAQNGRSVRIKLTYRF